MPKKIKLHLDDETKETWEAAQKAKAEVESWPAWKRGEPKRCNGRYIDFQGADRECLRGGEGCGLFGCVAAHGPKGSW